MRSSLLKQLVRLVKVLSFSKAVAMHSQAWKGHKDRKVLMVGECGEHSHGRKGSVSSGGR